MNEKPASRPGLLWQALIAPFVVLGLIGSLAMLGVFGKNKKQKKQPITKRAGKALSDLSVQQAVDAAQQALDEIRGQMSAQDLQGIKQQMSQRANTLVDSARTNLPPATQTASERAREVAADLGEIFRTEIAPLAKDWAQEAVQEAEEILSTARKKAEALTAQATPVVKQNAPEIGAKAGATAGLVAGTAATAAQTIAKRATNKKTKRGVARMTNRATNSMGNAVSTAGHQTMYVVSQSLLIFFWLGALGTVVYYALLSPSQREKVRNFLMGAASQLQDVVADFQSVNGEIPMPGQQQGQSQVPGQPTQM